MNKLNELAKQGKINDNASIKDGHSIIINAPIDSVWSALIDIDGWPSWNDDIKKVSIEGAPEVGADFSWTFDGTKFNSQIQSIDKPTTLSWTSKSKLAKSIHVWQLEDDENQTIVTLSTSMQGTFTMVFNNHQKIYNEILQWLQKLKEKAEE